MKKAVGKDVSASGVTDSQVLYGCLEGLAETEGDITQPVDVEWEAARECASDNPS